MKFTVLALMAAASVASAVTVTDAHKYSWEQFKVEHGKTYDAKEEPRRLEIFVKNLSIIAERNAAEIRNGGSAVHGINKFTDLHPDEFRERYLKSDPNQKIFDHDAIITKLEAPDAGSLVDWSDKYTTPVKDQAQCGSCWAFSATEQIESDIMRTTGQTMILSPQQIVSCDSTSYGCQGGWTENAYDYVKSSGGLELDTDYPYTSATGNSGQCQENASSGKVTLSGYTTIQGEDNMASYIQSTGPLSVCLDANTFNSYTGGIMTVCGNSVDHCVQAVGVLPDADTGYWKVRNSWGTGWGESGYIRLKYGGNLCDITNDPTYTDATVM
jgi:C1A family cysteine protease